MSFMDSLKKICKESDDSSYTENGALGYRTSGKHLLDLNFAAASLRSQTEKEIINRFTEAFYENRCLAVKWLFYASDVREGLGERRLFRICMKYLAENHPVLAKAVLSYIPEYSRWDNVLVMIGTEAEADVLQMILLRLEKDMEQLAQGKSVSLCAKWLPSVNASSAEARKTAKYLVSKFSLTEREYRKMLSGLRAGLHLVETDMSGGDWEEINYGAVPSRANLIYNKAFLRHDETRRRAFLERVKKGEASIHAGVLFPHDIVHRYYDREAQSWNRKLMPFDDTLEELWKALPDFTQSRNADAEDVFDVAGSTLCVSDGSGSMLTKIGKSEVCCLDVTCALAIYFAGHCEGAYKDQYITFSRHPQFVDLSAARTLREKLEITEHYNEVANTDIEAVFDLILETAVRNRLSQKELPANILVLSDMEFDAGVDFDSRNRPIRGHAAEPVETLFEGIGRRYHAAGYQLPRLIFWNLASRTGTVPLRENNAGVALVSGFSVNVLKMVLSGDTDPYQCLLRQLNSERYEAIEKAMSLVGCGEEEGRQ